MEGAGSLPRWGWHHHCDLVARQDGGPAVPEQLPSTLGSPGDQTTPGLLSVPPGPAGRSTEPASAPTHQRQTPMTTLASLQQDQQPDVSPKHVQRFHSDSPSGAQALPHVPLQAPVPPLQSSGLPRTHREAGVTRSALQRKAEMPV